MALARVLPVCPLGVWSHRQALKVIEANREAATEQGLEFVLLDISTHDAAHRAVLQARCIECHEPIGVDEAHYCRFAGLRIDRWPQPR